MATRKVSEPVQDALKAYLELALGLTEASKKKAEKAVKKMARELVGKGNSTAAQIQGAVEELVATSVANREAVTRLVRVEMDRALSRVGLATSEEVTTLQARVDALERELRDERAAGAKPLGRAAETAKAAPAAKAQPRPETQRKSAVAKTAETAVAKTAKSAVAKTAETTAAKAQAKQETQARQQAQGRQAERKPTAAKTAKATVVKKAPVVTKAPTVKAGASTAEVPVAQKKALAKKAVKKAVRANEAKP